jgi:Icc-related predicted phosphoesterase
MTPFSVAILADTHIRSTPEDPQACYPSDASMNERARRVVELIKARDPALAVHLGDITHTLPHLAAHGPTQRQARELLWSLDCALMVAPGNHDVGDKPSSRASAGRANREAHDEFLAIWGPPWMSLDHGGCRFITLDSPIMDTGDPLEEEQWGWLEQQLAEAERSFVFLHYPPFLLHPDEAPHYDNLGSGARQRLLDLLERHRVEALFAGHVHNFFHHRHQHTEHWLLPSTAFVRPEYSELFPVPPLAENGRDDPDKLGFALLHVDRVGHRLEWICPERVVGPQPEPPVPAPVGVWLRGGWARTVDLPAGDLDPFDRKPARNDWAELALMDLGLNRLRVQLADLGDPVLGPRLAQLAARGFEIQASSVGSPKIEHRWALEEHAEHLSCWEVVLPHDFTPRHVERLSESPVPVALSVVDPGEPGPHGYHSHFPEQGFDLDRPPQLPPLPPTVRWLVLRVPHHRSAWQAVPLARSIAEKWGLQALCHLELPRGDELHPPRDPHAASRVMAEALLAAAAHPSVRIMIDGLEDKDRGYHPRPGLVDRRFNPRPAARVLRSLTRLLVVAREPRLVAPGRFDLGDRELWLRPGGPGPWRCLETGALLDHSPMGPALKG